MADVKWTESAATDGEGSPATYYAATATYSGTASSQYATGYTVTADYSGEVAKTDCNMVFYTAIFGSTEIPEDQKKPAPSDPATPEDPDAPIVSVNWQRPVIIGGAVIAGVAALAFIIKKCVKGDKMRKKLGISLLTAALCALCVIPAGALEYTISPPADYLFAQATSDATIYEWENPNVDKSKNTALIAPGFGTPTSYLPNSGELLTPNLAAGSGSVVAIGGTSAIGTTGVVNGMATASGTVSYPTVSVGSTVQTTAFTDVTSDLYYSNGSLGILKIPSIGLTVAVYEGTASAPLLKGAGHFTGTSIWNGNVAVAGHNRGVRNDFGKLHTLKNGATITFTTKLGTRTYAVTSVSKISVNDTSGLTATSHNQLTLYTCVENQPAYRWCVTAVERAG